MGAFAYSAEEGTPAALLPNQIPDHVKIERHAALIESQFDVFQRKAKARVGRTEQVVLEEQEDGFLYGRTSREAPEIDAVVRLSDKKCKPGQFVEATLTGVDGYELTADLKASL
jgi:tRNA A37 methylthiotransferase MiaB